MGEYTLSFHTESGSNTLMTFGVNVFFFQNGWLDEHQRWV